MFNTIDRSGATWLLMQFISLNKINSKKKNSFFSFVRRIFQSYMIRSMNAFIYFRMDCCTLQWRMKNNKKKKFEDLHFHPLIKYLTWNYNSIRRLFTRIKSTKEKRNIKLANFESCNKIFVQHHCWAYIVKFCRSNLRHHRQSKHSIKMISFQKKIRKKNK